MLHQVMCETSRSVYPQVVGIVLYQLGHFLLHYQANGSALLLLWLLYILISLFLLTDQARISFCDKNMLCLGEGTSIPRKYLSLPKSLISNSFANCSFNLFFLFVLSPVMIVSPTLTRRAVGFPSLECFYEKRMTSRAVPIFHSSHSPCKSGKPCSRRLF